MNFKCIKQYANTAIYKEFGFLLAFMTFHFNLKFKFITPTGP